MWPQQRSCNCSPCAMSKYLPLEHEEEILEQDTLVLFGITDHRIGKGDGIRNRSPACVCWVLARTSRGWRVSHHNVTVHTVDTAAGACRLGQGCSRRGCSRREPSCCLLLLQVGVHTRRMRTGGRCRR
jgi:hypothetical protein